MSSHNTPRTTAAFIPRTDSDMAVLRSRARTARRPVHCNQVACIPLIVLTGWVLLMPDIFSRSVIFAQDAAPAVPGAPGGQTGLFQLLFMGMVIMAMFYFMLIRPSQKRDQERRRMMSGLKKNDHVVTIGGIKGVVANVKAEDDEVVIKVDEATGAKLRVVLSSIARVIAAEETAAGDKKES